ncbi:uncharacterized protein LOC111020577 [Momordica charantia]|uniref:Uncharacterized protein LOC111020577 n=1 Tax=Momordica charantia TaxID=3673 RepID=A0A6J1DHM3_MOMCH|nr:uncharacterized protein LOC111020577 [Momordica charantia]XP_022152965.1 uncharacterized protein LOC111020577 [Momordica charantia]
MHFRDKSTRMGSSSCSTDVEPDMNIRNIMKEINFLTSSHMSWKDKKEIENRKIVSLGGKPQKKQKLPLSVARPIMKKQKEREQKMMEERLNLGQSSGNNSRRSMGKRKPEDQVLRPSEGIFRNGVLDVKHLLHRAPTRNTDFAPIRNTDFGNDMVGKGRRKGGKKKNKSKKKGGGKKRH